MRQLTEWEKKELHEHCLFCKGVTIRMGPVGGMAINIYCVNCHAGYNVSHEMLPWQLIRNPAGGYPDVNLSAPIPLDKFLPRLTLSIEKSMREAYEKMKP
jgi:hypothetical protein